MFLNIPKFYLFVNEFSEYFINSYLFDYFFLFFVLQLFKEALPKKEPPSKRTFPQPLLMSHYRPSDFPIN